jgi:hypothetical protein
MGGHILGSGKGTSIVFASGKTEREYVHARPKVVRQAYK